jgi:hypothetical protein
LGGVSRTVRGVQKMRHVLKLQTILAGWALLRSMGVLGVFSNASLAARTCAGLAPLRRARCLCPLLPLSSLPSLALPLCPALSR